MVGAKARLHEPPRRDYNLNMCANVLYNIYDVSKIVKTILPIVKAATKLTLRAKFGFVYLRRREIMTPQIQVTFSSSLLCVLVVSVTDENVSLVY